MALLPIALFWGLCIGSLFLKRPLIVYVFLCSLAFGATAAVPTQLTGGVTLLSTPIATIFLMAWLVRQRLASNVVAELLSPRTYLLLTVFVLFGALSAMILPILFDGRIFVIPMRGRGVADFVSPSIQNLTQTLYLAISLLAAACLLVVAKIRTQTLFQAAIACGLAFVVSGALDFASKGTNALDFLRTATYTFRADASIGELKRVVGLMSEASAFGLGCTSVAAILYFARPGLTLTPRWHTLWTIAVPGLLLMAILSASSTAYAMLGVFGIAVIFQWAMGTAQSRGRFERSTTLFSIIGVITIAAATLGVVVFAPRLLDPVFDIVSTLLFDKTDSRSFAIRSRLNELGWEAFLSSGGLGVGIGTARTSSWPLSVLSSTGVIGSTILAGFLLRVFGARTRTTSSKRHAQGAKLAMIVVIAGMSLSSTTPDFGPYLAMLFAFVLSAATAPLGSAVDDRSGLTTALTSAQSSPVSPRTRSATSGPRRLRQASTRSRLLRE